MKPKCHPKKFQATTKTLYQAIEKTAHGVQRAEDFFIFDGGWEEAS